MQHLISLGIVSPAWLVLVQHLHPSPTPAVTHAHVFIFLYSHWGDKVSMLIHTYPHKPLGKITVPYTIPTLTAHFIYGL